MGEVIFGAFEDSLQASILRGIAKMTGIDADRLTRGEVSSAEFADFVAASNCYRDAFAVIDGFDVEPDTSPNT